MRISVLVKFVHSDVPVPSLKKSRARFHLPLLIFNVVKTTVLHSWCKTAEWSTGVEFILVLMGMYRVIKRWPFPSALLSAGDPTVWRNGNLQVDYLSVRLHELRKWSTRVALKTIGVHQRSRRSWGEVGLLYNYGASSSSRRLREEWCFLLDVSKTLTTDVRAAFVRRYPLSTHTCERCKRGVAG